MPQDFIGANDIDVKELEDLFNDDIQQETPPANDEQTPPDNDVSQTKAFAKRLKESTDKVRMEEREAIAKSLGFNSYEELQKSRERKVYEDKGLDPDEVSPIVDEIVKQKLNDDPRIKELELFRAKQVEEFGKRELAEITKLTEGEITKLEQLPTDVIDLWKKKGSLKAAYLELKGEELILKARSGQSKGSTSHLAGTNGNASADSKKRPLTEKEKQLWKLFNPNMTDEELNNKMVEN
jgi:hypothetical protein